MQSKKKMIVNTVFLVAIFALTIYGVFHGEDLGAMMEAMRRADVRWLLPGLLCVVFFIWGESIIVLCILLWDSFSAVSHRPQAAASRCSSTI